MNFIREDEPKRLKILLYADAKATGVGQTLPYMEFMSQFGEVVLVHSQNDLPFYIDYGDVLVVPGGPDVSSTYYHSPPGFTNGRANAHYEYLDQYLLKPWLKTGKPTIGICRGLQTINVALGGDLYQHIIGHQQKKDRDVTTDEMYTDIKGYNIVDINSIHHQAIKNIADELEVIGWATAVKNCPSHKNKKNRNALIKNGMIKHIYKTEGEKLKSEKNGGVGQYFCIVEAVKSKADSKHNIVAFQYHPEELNCDFAITQINNLLSSYYVDNKEKARGKVTRS